MRLAAVLMMVFLFAGMLCAAEPLEVKRAGPPAAAASGLGGAGSRVVDIAEFEVRGGLPAWLGRSLQHSAREELSQLAGISVASGGDASTQPATRPSPDYLIRGQCSGSSEVMMVSVDVLHAGSETLIQSVTVSGHPTDLLQIKAALRSELRRLFAPAEVRGRRAPAEQPAQPQAAGPVANVAEDLSMWPGREYEGSALEWALSNPQRFERQVREDQRSSRVGVQGYRSAGTTGRLIMPRTQPDWTGSGFRVEGQYRSGNFELRLSN